MADTRTRIINLPEATTLDSSINLIVDSADGSGTRRVTYDTLKEAINKNLAHEYSNTATYAVGDLCTYKGTLYSCSTAISTAEAWTAAHWTAVHVSTEISGLKNTLADYNAFDVFGNMPNKSGSHNGITFKYTKNACDVSGTATANAWLNLYDSKTALPLGIEANATYKFTCTMVSGVRFEMFFYNSSGELIGGTSQYISTDRSVTIPSTAVGMTARVGVLSGTAISGTQTVTYHMANTLSNKELAKSIIELQEEIDANDPYCGYKEYSLIDGTHNGLTYTFDQEMNRCHVTGTANNTSFRNIYYNISKLPDGLNTGDTFILYYATSNKHLVCGVYFRLSDGTDVRSELATYSQVITVPENAVGMYFRYMTYSGYTLDDYAVIPLLVKMKRQTFIPFKAKRPLMVSIIDDDTSTDDLVDKFYQNCKHNGVVGAYAVVTKQYIEGTSTISKLLDIEADGFNMIPHCHEQQTYLYPANNDYDPVLAFKNYAQCLRDFRTLGLINPQNLWIIPYGSSDSKAINMGKDLGFEMSFTTEGTTNNYLTQNDKYRLHRCGLSALADVTDDSSPTATGSMAKCKARVDELVASETGGWLILMTHFNTWQSETWDSTLDSNGYAKGYARFNELVQYVKDSGCEIVSMAQGAAYMKPIIDRNFTIG